MTITATHALSSVTSASTPSSLVAATGARPPAALPPAGPVLSRLHARPRRFRIGPLPPWRHRLQIRAFNAAGREPRPHFLRITGLR